jgi:hypothetical protein
METTMEVEFDLLKACREAATYDARHQAEQRLQEEAATLVGKTVAISVIGGTPLAKGKVLQVECPKTFCYFPLIVKVREKSFEIQRIWINPDRHIIMVS